MVKEADKILNDYYLSLNYFPTALNQVLRRNGIKEAKRLCFSARMFLEYSRKKVCV
jgi:hypothetical protein